MTDPLRLLLTAAKAASQLGLRQTGLYAWYRFLLHSGWLRRLTPSQPPPTRTTFELASPLELPEQSRLASWLPAEAQDRLLGEAAEHAAGQVRLFGGEPRPLRLAWPGPLRHWTEYEVHPELWQAWSGDCSGPVGEAGPGNSASGDIKYIWEPARFGWAFTLARAYHLSGEETFAAAFWRSFEQFQAANPPNLGPNWLSAQEVALRLLALVFAGQVFAAASESTPARRARLAEAVAAHAARIPPSLAYARSQHNNHLLTEAAGLITAALALPGHPAARRWLELGRLWFNAGLQAQIASDGAYAQHSTNYHRLLLHCALWVQALRPSQAADLLAPASRRKLAAATRWLLALTDPLTGRAPNLGPNDGACLLPLSSSPFEDYRPVLQAAGRAFLNQQTFEPGPHDELALWLCRAVSAQSEAVPPGARSAAQPAGLPAATRLESRRSWAYLRAAVFTSRPGHADQLHLDLWWRGLNLAQDAGTYSYNAAPPWDNALACTAVHNTLTVAGRDQMSRAGRFLWLDWAQARIIERSAAPTGGTQRLVAQHDGYRHLGIIHQRRLTTGPDDNWIVEDWLLPAGRSTPGPQALRLHWLLPDWPWQIQAAGRQVELYLASPYGEIRLAIGIPAASTVPTLSPQLCRAGTLLYGAGPVPPTWGWVSPSYGQKIPALSLAVSATAHPPAGLISEWRLPE